MTKDRAILFFGIRVELSELEVELCEMGMHPLMIEARKVGLQSYYSNVASPDEQYFLFIGKLLGIVGRENEDVIRTTPDYLNGIATLVTTKLAISGIHGEPTLFMQLELD
jgi:hypothetical protein